jgi:NAD(P) transhydrogenase
MVGVGGFFIMGGGILPHTFPQVMGALSVLLAFVNVSGGFVITKRMLDMFKRMLHVLLEDPSDKQKAPLIHPSIHGFMLFLVSSSLVATLLLPVLAWLVLSKQDTSQALSCASDLCPGWLLKPQLVKAILLVY